MRHKKIYHFILTAVLISAIILPLSGCTLAKKDAGEDAKDTLIGVFVTEEYLDLFGTDAYLYGQYANPLYATVNRHGSDELSDWEVSFQNIRGLNFLQFSLRVRSTRYFQSSGNRISDHGCYFLLSLLVIC